MARPAAQVFQQANLPASQPSSKPSFRQAKLPASQVFIVLALLATMISAILALNECGGSNVRPANHLLVGGDQEHINDLHLPQRTTMPMERTYVELKGRWLAGERDRELALRLMYFSWMHWAEPPFVTGYADDPEAPGIWRAAFIYLGGESSDDAEFLYVSGIMAELFPWALGDEMEWEQRGQRIRARAKELQPDGITLGVFDNRGGYGEYFAHQLRGDSFPFLTRSAQE